MEAKRKGVIVSVLVTVIAAGAITGTAIALGNASDEPDKLGDIYGFRSGEEGRAEDDLIALWHTFDRERYIRECMGEVGFNYSIAVAFPHSSMLMAARALNLRGDISPHPRLVEEIDILQTAEMSALSPSDRDPYYLRLLGETAEDVAYVDSTGLLPGSRNDFATGGCWGAAWDAIPGHYVLTDEILAEVREAKISESSFIEPCITEDELVLDDLAALDEMYEELSASGMNPQDVEDSLLSCEDHLLAADNAARERARATIFDRHEARLKSHHRKFENIFTKIESDREFLVYLDSLVRDLEREFADETAPYAPAPGDH